MRRKGLVKDGFVVVLLDGTVSLAVKAFVAIGEVAAILIPCLVIGDQCAAFLAGGVAVIPATLAQDNALITFTILAPNAPTTAVAFSGFLAEALLAQHLSVKGVAIFVAYPPSALAAHFSFVHVVILR